MLALASSEKNVISPTVRVELLDLDRLDHSAGQCKSHLSSDSFFFRKAHGILFCFRGALHSVTILSPLSRIPRLVHIPVYTVHDVVQGVAAVAHSMVKPMDPKYFEKVGPPPIEVDSVLHSSAAPGLAAFGKGGMPPSMYSHMIPASALPRQQ